MDVNFSPQGPPDVVLPPPPPSQAAELDRADSADAVAAVVANDPTYLEAWATLGDMADSESMVGAVESYAYYRVGYHRGLDALRKNGWKGSGFVRWSSETNRGFLRCLQGLGQMAERIGESDESLRCAEFLNQLDPNGPWAE